MEAKPERSFDELHLEHEELLYGYMAFTQENPFKWVRGRSASERHSGKKEIREVGSSMKATKGSLILGKSQLHVPAHDLSLSFERARSRNRQQMHVIRDGSNQRAIDLRPEAVVRREIDERVNFHLKTSVREPRCNEKR